MAYLFWHFIWHFFWPTSWHSFWNSIYLASIQTYFLAYLLTFFLAFYLIYFRKFFAVEVGGGSLWSSGYCSGPAGNTAMTSLQLRIGGWHSDPGFAVRARRGPRRSRVFSWGPVGNILDPACKWGPAENWSGPARIAAITSLQLRSGGEHSSSRVCCSGPVGANAIISLQLISGGEHSAPELAVLVRQGPLRCSAGNWGPVKEEKEEEKKEEEEEDEATWHKVQ